jgi:hypothetical protein
MEIGNGVTGWANVAHRGFVSVIFDEVMGIVNKQVDKKKSIFTAYLNITFKRSIPTPSIILCHTWINKEGMV